jgi:hypothetical protein
LESAASTYAVLALLFAVPDKEFKPSERELKKITWL